MIGLKFKIRNKTYTIIEIMPNVEETIINNIYKVIDSKKQEYILIKSSSKYTLYKDNKVVLKTYSITGLN